MLSQKEPNPSYIKNRKQKGLELLKHEKSGKSIPIPTFCQSLDTLLDGGIRPGTMTEVVGDKGLGKTTFCLQLCLNVQLPLRLQGLASQAVFIDTENSFSTVRLSEMTQEFLTHCSRVMELSNPIKKDAAADAVADAAELSVDQVLSNIHFTHCLDQNELVEVILGLDRFLAKHSKVKLIVIDSMAFPFYMAKDDFSNRVKVLYGIGQLLFRLMNKYGVAVVITNNLTVRFNESCGIGENNSTFVPYLGDSWNHIPNRRMLFEWTPNCGSRKAQLLKSPYAATEGSVVYRILAGGFRD